MAWRIKGGKHGSGTATGGGITSGGGTLALERTFNNPTGSSTGSTAFWTIGHPFKLADVPTGNIVTATLGGTGVPVQAIARKLHSDGSLAWAQLLIDLSAAPIATVSSASLVLTSATGSWSTTTSRSNANWTALTDTVEITNLSCVSGTGQADMDGAGTWVAAFDGVTGNDIETYGSSPLGLWVSVKANFKNGGTTHAYLRARMEYWVTQKQDTSLGPIASRGPFIENMQAFKKNAANNNVVTEFDYDLNWKRGGVSKRSMTGVPHILLTTMALPREDGQWDWTASDPGIYVTQDYVQARKTKKIPPYRDSIAYVGTGSNLSLATVSAINTSTGVFTVDQPSVLVGGTLRPTGVIVQATTLPTGLTASSSGEPVPSGKTNSILYWASYTSGTTITLYDTLAHAQSAGATGKVIPSSSGSTVKLMVCVAPSSVGAFHQGMPDAGDRPDLGLFTEYGDAYILGGTQAFSRTGRIYAYNFLTIPFQVLEHTTGKIPSLLPSGDTPAGMTNSLNGSAGESTYYTEVWSSNISGGSPTGGRNNWTTNPHHWTGSAAYPVWLFEGGTILRDCLLANGNQGLGQAFARAPKVSGTTYNGVPIPVYDGLNLRGYSWAFRDWGIARFVAAQGSAEETYFTTVLTRQGSFLTAWKAFEGTNFTNLGIPCWNYGSEDTSVATIERGALLSFHLAYMQIALGWPGMAMNGDNAGITNWFNFLMQWPIALFNSSFCSYWGTAHLLGPKTDDGGAGGPNTWVSSVADVGMNSFNEAIFSIDASGVVTWTAEGDGTLGFTLLNGDKFRFQNWGNRISVGLNTAPSPFSDGTDYFVVNATGSSFKLSATGGGSAITPSGARSNIGGQTIPTQSGSAGLCPASGDVDGTYTLIASSLSEQIAALAIGAVAGYSGASAAYTNALARFAPADHTYNQVARYAFQDSV